jgi:hypothetical protein
MARSLRNLSRTNANDEACHAMKVARKPRRMEAGSISVGVLILSVTLASLGCNGTNSLLTGSTPPTLSQAGALNSYSGTQATGDVWQLSINHNTNSFSALDQSQLTSSGSPLTFAGIFVFNGGFLDFTQTNSSPAFQPFGFTMEIPGRVAFMIPDSAIDSNGNPAAAPPIASVPGGCWSFVMGVNFQFVTMPYGNWSNPGSNWNAATDTAYGGFQVSTGGTTWYLDNLAQFTLGKSPSQASATFSPGLCASSAVGTVISLPSNATISSTDTLVVGPSGFFVLNQGPNTSPAVGLMQPTSALNTGSLVSFHYLGFVSEPAIQFPSPTTPPQPSPNQIASFGPCSTSSCSSAGASLIGGGFPLDNPADSRSDDPTQPASTNIIINLGAQNAASNGLYDSAAVTIPDPLSLCTAPGTPGQDSQGNPTCTVPAVAIAGNPESRYAIFLIAQDVVNSSPMAIYLFQE